MLVPESAARTSLCRNADERNRQDALSLVPDRYSGALFPVAPPQPDHATLSHFRQLAGTSGTSTPWL